MSDFPSTIIYPDAFKKSETPRNDGVFDWSFMEGCFGDTKIMPTDFDCVVERKYHYLIIETKQPGVMIPTGQLLALTRLNKAKSFTIMKIWGKNNPLEVETISPNMAIKKFSGKYARQLVMDWFNWADKL